MLVSLSELDIIPIRFAITTASFGPTTSASGGTISSENPNPLSACANEAAPASTTTAANSTQSTPELARRRGVRANGGWFDPQSLVLGGLRRVQAPDGLDEFRGEQRSLVPSTGRRRCR